MKPYALLLTLALILLALAGCHETPAEEENPQENGEDKEPAGRQGPLLEEFLSCRGDYPQTETPVRCENEITELEPQNELVGLDFGCVAEAPAGSDRPSLRLHWSDEEARHALEYNASRGGNGLSGILAIQEENGTQFYNWNHNNRSAFLLLPALEPGSNLTAWAFLNTYQTDSQRLAGGSIRVDWSLHEDDPYPVRVIETEDDEYFFHHAAYNPDAEVFPYFWHEKMELPGGDFNLWITYEKLMETSITVPADGGDPDGC